MDYPSSTANIFRLSATPPLGSAWSKGPYCACETAATFFPWLPLLQNDTEITGTIVGKVHTEEVRRSESHIWRTNYCENEKQLRATQISTKLPTNCPLVNLKARLHPKMELQLPKWRSHFMSSGEFQTDIDISDITDITWSHDMAWHGIDGSLFALGDKKPRVPPQKSTPNLGDSTGYEISTHAAAARCRDLSMGIV